jgi:hypothetical protein
VEAAAAKDLSDKRWALPPASSNMVAMFILGGTYEGPNSEGEDVINMKFVVQIYLPDQEIYCDSNVP